MARSLWCEAKVDSGRSSVAKILITGSSGYIGQHLVKMLRPLGHELHGLDIRPSESNLDKFYHLNILATALPREHYDTVIHLAALVNVGESVLRPDLYYHTNLNGTVNVLERISCDNFVFASTGAAVQCESPYGISKRAAEDMVKHLRRDKDYTIFRFYNVIGSDGIAPTNPDGLFYNLMRASDTGTFTIYGTDYATLDGTCVRDYVHVNEICDALMQSIDRSSQQIENLGHGRGHTVKQMIDIFKRINAVEFTIANGPRRAGDVESSVLDDVSSYMRELYSLEELLRYK